MLHDEHSSSSSAGAELDLEQLLLNPQPEHGGAAGQSDSGDEVLSASGLVERVRSLFVLESLLPDQLLGVSCSAELECLERDLLGEARRQCGSSAGTQQQSFKRIQLLEVILPYDYQINPEESNSFVYNYQLLSQSVYLNYQF